LKRFTGNQNIQRGEDKFMAIVSKAKTGLAFLGLYAGLTCGGLGGAYAVTEKTADSAKSVHKPLPTATVIVNTDGELVSSILGGAAQGAALGAIGGAIAGDAGKGAAIGAAVGGVLGAF
jgi:hypothetical protein